MDDRYTLPINQTQEHILETINRHQVTIIRGETGSGKTTQVPQYILDQYIKQGRGAECNIVATQVDTNCPPMMYFKCVLLGSRFRSLKVFADRWTPTESNCAVICCSPYNKSWICLWCSVWKSFGLCQSETTHLFTSFLFKPVQIYSSVLFYFVQPLFIWENNSEMWGWITFF